MIAVNIHRRSEQNCTVGGINIEVVNEFIYLDLQLNEQKDPQITVKHHLAAGNSISQVT